MFIALNGQLGSGKSAICEVLKRHGFEVFTTGTIQRAMAREMGISTLELNERGKEDPSYDYEIDSRLKKYAEENEGRDIVFDSRMAWHFVPESYKVHLLVSPYIAAKRVYENRTSDVERFSSLEDAERELQDRRRSEIERYELIYGVDMSDLSNYDLILDTSHLTIDEVGETVYKHAKSKKKAALVSPRNIYPTVNTEEVDRELADKYVQDLKTGGEIPEIELIFYDDRLYIYSGHEQVVAYNRLRRDICSAREIYQPGQTLPEGKMSVTDFVQSKILFGRVRMSEWEAMNGFRYRPDAE